MIVEIQKGSARKYVQTLFSVCIGNTQQKSISVSANAYQYFCAEGGT